MLQSLTRNSSKYVISKMYIGILENNSATKKRLNYYNYYCFLTSLLYRNKHSLYGLVQVVEDDKSPYLLSLDPHPSSSQIQIPSL